ncbi:hypothetical protein [Arvimicrobium flavum]|uniref:hypothetical protein n=1 Tax=Arvimicrobium flavum TaxID=3393320 RepID=UPI00237BF419|nr:hypothetical protein [Mesorhizobium shangrilense]
MRFSSAIFPLAFLPILALPASGAEKRFEDASESNKQLIALYEQAGDTCVRNRSRDVQVTVACMSMTVYGLALNERGWCYGKQSEANAVKQWHECQEDSDRFSESSLTQF